MRIVERMGLFVFFVGAVWDLIYHVLPLVTGYVWPKQVDAIEYLGHTATLVGVVIMISAVLWMHRS